MLLGDVRLGLSGSWSTEIAEGPVKLRARSCRNTNDRSLGNEIFVPHLVPFCCSQEPFKSWRCAGRVTEYSEIQRCTLEVLSYEVFITLLWNKPDRVSF